MSATVSYANVAAKGEEKDVPVPQSEAVFAAEAAASDIAIPADVSAAPAAAAPSESAAADAAASEDAAATAATDAATAAKSAAEKAKRALAPAPVPAKSAWGASSNAATPAVDETKWPTPDKVVVSQSQQPIQKFIKPITNKWVPITAKVVLPNAKPSAKSQNRNRKTKKPQLQANQPSGQPASQKKPIKKKSEESDLAEDFSSAESSTFSNSNGSGADDDSKAKKRAGQSFKPRFNQNGQTGQFFQPQPFNPNYQYNNINNRQFRPQQQGPNGAQQAQGQKFRPNNTYVNQGNNIYRNGPQYANGGFNNGFIPHPHQQQQQVQIPPPISPKQDPQQALIQQINYYFSPENLVRDFFLRKNMLVDGGWVPLGLILDFKRIKIIINGIQNASEQDIETNQVIFDSILKCDNLEVRHVDGVEDKIESTELRVKDNYQQWLLPSQ